jgi:hypothetical protein
MTSLRYRLMTLFKSAKGRFYTEIFLLLVGFLVAFATIVVVIAGHTQDQIVKITGQQSSVFIQSMR